MWQLSNLQIDSPVIQIVQSHVLRNLVDTTAAITNIATAGPVDQLRGLPLVGSECVCPQSNTSVVITRGSAKPSAFAFPSISQELTRNANRKGGTPVTVKSPTVKCPMVRSQGYSTLQKPISGYQPQVGSERVALINRAVRTLGNDYVPQIVVSLITT